MKTFKTILALIALILAAFAQPLSAQIVIPSDGSDGALNITSNTVIDLSQAVTGVWSNNNSGNAGKGIYDISKWAVVFKYSSVNIASNMSVTFSNHPSRAPVVWLVTGNVTINGELNLDGATYSTDPLRLAEPGPGGFRGGASLQGSFVPAGSGFGPGGFPQTFGYYSGIYGSPQIIPVLGGSGGAGNSTGGGGGGGAILIACPGVITVNGSCHANGGIGNWHGSGGAIRLVADQIQGSGSLLANFYNLGRIRLEANTFSVTLGTAPAPSMGLPTPVMIWPPTNAATVRLVSIGSQSAPVDPRAQIGTSQDTTLFTNSAPVVVETANFPTNGTVNVFIKPRNGNPITGVATYVSGTTNLATWQYQATIPLRDSVVQARAFVP
jgi:hypothetical protein